MNKLVLGILVSGRGSNMQAIIDSIKADRLNARIGVVISDNANAKAFERLDGLDIPAICIERKSFATKGEFEAAITNELIKYKVELVVLAGFMKILGSNIINAYPGRIMNIHPSLLPSFPGLHAHEQAISYGAKVSGCTVHFVDEGMDTGPIILQQAVPVLTDDTAETLSERILTVEHQLYPEAIKLYSENKLVVEDRKVRILK